MRIGLIADGQSEVGALPQLLNRLGIPDVIIIGPRYADLQPKATAAQIAKAAESRIRTLMAQAAVDRIVIMIDHEDRDDCPGEWARTLCQEFVGNGFDNVSVVVKNRKFENWLIADPENIQEEMPARFSFDRTVVRSIQGGGADNIEDAELILDRASIGKNYNKTKDASQICRNIEPLMVAKNSRSFRRFLRLLGHPQYRNQSIRAAR